MAVQPPPTGGPSYPPPPAGYQSFQQSGYQNAPPPPASVGGFDDDYIDYPPPEPVKPTAQFRGIANSRHSGKIFLLHNINKISSGQGKEEPRTIMLTSLFLLQLDKAESPVIKRAVLLTEISHFEYDRARQKVLMKIKSGLPERDWLFKLSSGALPEQVNMNLEAMAQIINACRAPLVDAHVKPVFVLNHIKSTPNIAKPPNYKSAKKRMQEFKRHPERLPQPRRRRRPQPRYPPGFEPLPGPPRTYNVVRTDANEDLGFTYTVSEELGIIMIDTVVEGGAFHRAGIPPGQLHSLDGFPIRSDNDMPRVIRERILKFPVELTPDPKKVPLPPYKPPPDPIVERDDQRSSDGLTDDISSDPGDEEELLVNKLKKMCQLKRKGVIEGETYEKAKNHICKKLITEEDESDHEQDLEKRKPPAPYAVVNIGRYIYLRTHPERGSPWVGTGGVHGTLMAMHTVGDWTYVRTHDNRQGYLRTHYLNFCQTPPEVTRKSKKKNWERHLSDILSQAESSVYGEERMYDRYSQQPRGGQLAPSTASSWGPSAPSHGSNWYDPELLYAANSSDQVFDENTWMTV